MNQRRDDRPIRQRRAAGGAPIALVLAALAAWPVSGSPPSTEELRALFVYSFTTYIEWPSTQPGRPLVVGVIGDPDLSERILKIATGHKGPATQRTVAVRDLDEIDEIGACDVVYLAAKADVDPSKLLSLVSDNPVLTVSEEEGTARRGLAISFREVEGQLRFEINRAALARANLTASSHLLKLAILVEEDPDVERSLEKLK